MPSSIRKIQLFLYILTISISFLFPGFHAFGQGSGGGVTPGTPGEVTYPGDGVTTADENGYTGTVVNSPCNGNNCTQIDEDGSSSCWPANGSSDNRITSGPCGGGGSSYVGIWPAAPCLISPTPDYVTPNVHYNYSAGTTYIRLQANLQTLDYYADPGWKDFIIYAWGNFGYSHQIIYYIKGDSWNTWVPIYPSYNANLSSCSDPYGDYVGWENLYNSIGSPGTFKPGEIWSRIIYYNRLSWICPVRPITGLGIYNYTGSVAEFSLKYLEWLNSIYGNCNSKYYWYAQSWNGIGGSVSICPAGRWYYPTCLPVKTPQIWSFTVPELVNTQGTYSVNINAKWTGEDNNCPASGGSVSGLDVEVWNDLQTEKYGEGTTGGSGTVTVSGIPQTSTTLTLVTSYQSEEKAGILTCNGSNEVSGSPIKVSFSGNVACTTQVVNLGISEQTKVPWEIAIDGDVYAGEVNVPIDSSGTAGDDFSFYLINTLNSTGFNKVAGNINIDTTLVSEEGGYASGLSDKSHDVWLSRLDFSGETFLEDNDNVEEISGFSDLESNKTYKMTLSDFNGEDNLTYNIDGGASVLYITDSGDESLTIASEVTTEGDGRLVLVTDAPVLISSDVSQGSLGTGSTVPGGSVTAYTIESNSKLALTIITNSDITFESKDETATVGQDDPIMVDGSLITTGNIEFNRDIGAFNSAYPAEAVRYYDKNLYYLTKLERDNDDTYFTGLATYDVQWDYGE